MSGLRVVSTNCVLHKLLALTDNESTRRAMGADDVAASGLHDGAAAELVVAAACCAMACVMLECSCLRGDDVWVVSGWVLPSCNAGGLTHAS